MTACNCIDEMNAVLRERNAELLVTLYPAVRPIIETQKIDSRKRGKPPMAIASYCPFCGLKYEPLPNEAGAPAEADAPPPNSEAPLPDDAGEHRRESKPDRGTNPTGTGG